MKKLSVILVIITTMIMLPRGFSQSSPHSNQDSLIVMVSLSHSTLAVCNEYSGDTLRCFDVRVGLNPGPKMVQGDKKNPVGEYKIIAKYRHYVWFLLLDYPNEQDRAESKTGGGIGIHYLGTEMVRGSIRADGSSGCITVWNKEEILYLNETLPVGTTVLIYE